MNYQDKIFVLKILSDKNVRWTWHTLDRALSRQGRAGMFHVVNLANELSNEGLIQQIIETNPSMPVYTITEKGLLEIATR